MDCSQPGSSVYEISQASILEWIAILFSRRSSQPRDQTQVSCITGRFFLLSEPPGSSKITFLTFEKCGANSSAPALEDAALANQEVSCVAIAMVWILGAVWNAKGGAAHGNLSVSWLCPGFGCYLRAHGADGHQKTQVNKVTRKISQENEGPLSSPLPS